VEVVELVVVVVVVAAVLVEVVVVVELLLLLLLLLLLILPLVTLPTTPLSLLNLLLLGHVRFAREKTMYNCSSVSAQGVLQSYLRRIAISVNNPCPAFLSINCISVKIVEIGLAANA
jgi:hypothetical protein